MEFLRLLEGIRNPVLDKLMLLITQCGDEIFFMALGLILFWCIDKKKGYFLLFAGFAGTAAVQLLKVMFRIPRPWVLDPNFTIVEGASSGARDFSFPSGHSANIAAIMGGLLLCAKKKTVRFFAWALLILVPFSRMYLGVHTPKDVAVGLIVGFLFALLFFVLIRSLGENRGYVVCTCILAVTCVASLLYIGMTNFPADVDMTRIDDSAKNLYTVLGAGIGLMIVAFFDRKTDFDTKAPFLGQVLKLAIGMGLTIGLRMGLKPLLNLIFSGHHVADMIRYGLMVIFAGAVWPLTFPFFAKIGWTYAPREQ